MTQFIPVYQPTLSGNESKYVNACLDAGWISSKGEFVGRFEAAFAQYLQCGYATSVCNGTVALHLALHALGIQQGDEVIVPTLTYIASVNAIAYVGATPVFVDSELQTWNLDVSQIEAKITKKTKAVMAVHLYGAVCDMVGLREICTKHGLLLIEDVAEAFGSQSHGRFAGTFGDMATFSFFGNKTITTGEGGMVVSNDSAKVARAAYLKSQAVSPTREYWHDELGFNFRMTNICASIGVAQLEQADSVIAAKRRLAAWYQEDLKGLALTFQAELPDTVHTYWMVSVLAEDTAMRDRIRQVLKESGVETRPLFPPAHMMSVFRSKEVFPVAESLSGRGLNLPSYPALTKEQVSYVSAKIKEAIKSDVYR
jgi:perosamine synthetase